MQNTSNKYSDRFMKISLSFFYHVFEEGLRVWERGVGQILGSLSK